MGSGKGMVAAAAPGPILRMPKKGAKGPGKTPVLPMPVKLADDLTEASGNCSSPAASGGTSPSHGEGQPPHPSPPKGPKGKGKAKGPPGHPPPKAGTIPDMSPTAEIPVTPGVAKSSPKGKGEGKGPSKGPPKGSPPAKGPGKGPPNGSPNAPGKGGAKGKGEGKGTKAAPRLQEHAPLGKKLHWKADYEERCLFVFFLRVGSGVKSVGKSVAIFSTVKSFLRTTFDPKDVLRI